MYQFNRDVVVIGMHLCVGFNMTLWNWVVICACVLCNKMMYYIHNINHKQGKKCCLGEANIS